MVDIKELKAQLTDEHIIKLLRSLGSDSPAINDHNVMSFQTVCHNLPSTDNKYKLYYYKNTKLFSCYTGCGDTFDIFQLVNQAIALQKNETLTIQECANYVIEVCEMTFWGGGNTTKKKQEWGFLGDYVKAKNVKEVQIEQVTYNKNVLDVFQNLYLKEWLDEGITKEAMDAFNVRYWLKEDQVIIPHYDINGELVGIRSRNMRSTLVNMGMKYIPTLVQKIRYRHNTSLNLYGLNVSKNAIKKTKRAILFEGEKSCMKSYSYYGEDSIACAVCGSNIFKTQINYLLNLGVSEVVIAFDKQYENNNERGRYLMNLIQIASTLTPYMTTYILIDKDNLLDYKDSPVDKGKEVFEKLMENKILVK